jgi:hypothetical protein
MPTNDPSTTKPPARGDVVATAALALLLIGGAIALALSAIGDAPETAEQMQAARGRKAFAEQNARAQGVHVSSPSVTSDGVDHGGRNTTYVEVKPATPVAAVPEYDAAQRAVWLVRLRWPAALLLAAMGTIVLLRLVRRMKPAT